MQMIGYYRKIDVFVSCSACFSSPCIRIANKLEVDAVICGWSKTGLKSIVLSNCTWLCFVDKHICCGSN